MSPPMDEFDEKLAADSLRDRQAKELQYWHQWSEAETDKAKRKAVHSFFESFQPRLNSWRRRLGSSTLPKAIVDSEISTRALDAFQKYDPGKGAQISTWIDNNMKGIYRWALDAQNIGRIPSHRQALIGTFQRVKEELTQNLHRPPSAAEIADAIPADLATVEKLERELRKDIHLTDELSSVMTEDVEDQELNRIVDLVYYELGEPEKVVYEHWFGKHGKPQISGNEIAALMGKSPSAISEIKNQIRAKIERYSLGSMRGRLK
jgi:RNA polymerase sigma factor (sigma-70 family)